MNASVLMPNGTTIRIETVPGRDNLTSRIVVIDNPNAPADVRNTELGRLVAPGTIQFAPFLYVGLGPDSLRALTTLMEKDVNDHAEGSQE